MFERSESCERSELITKNNSNTKSKPEFYGYMITIKNNTCPRKVKDRDNEWLRQATATNFIMAKCKHELAKQAYELDSLDNLHLHTVVVSHKITNREWIVNKLKAELPDYKTYHIHIQVANDPSHFVKMLKYLNDDEDLKRQTLEKFLSIHSQKKKKTEAQIIAEVDASSEDNPLDFGLEETTEEKNQFMAMIHDCCA